jgi:phospholipase/carboxylesterase
MVRMAAAGIDTFIHRFQPAVEGGPKAVLLLLHGTGGDENDLGQLAALIAPEAAWLSPRGKVLENGMPRWFRRIAEGVFDEDDLRARTGELAGFVAAAAAHYGFAGRPLYAAGFSNGANIASAMLLLRPEVLAGAVLLRAMLPFRAMPAADLAGRAVFIGAGRADPMVPAGDPERLAEALRAGGADVTLHVTGGGHGLSMQDVEAARDWLAPRL